MNTELIKSLAKELNVDFETLKTNYERIEEELKPFEDSLRRSQILTAEDFNTRVGGDDC
jgi:hypothetical protein